MPIHPLAVVDPKAEIHPEAVIGPFCYVSGAVAIGARTELRSHACIYGRARIGEDCIVFPGAVIGSDPQDLKFKGEDSDVVIGARCRIHECVTVSKGTASGGMSTTIGDDVLVMAYAHVAHDCHVADGVVIANNAQLAGHCRIGRKSVIGGMVGMHHFVTVGELAIVSGMAGVRFDVPPFIMAEGNPAEPRNINIIGLRRDGWSEPDIEDLRVAFRELYHDREKKSLREALEEVRDTFEAKPASPVHRLCDWLQAFLENNIRGRVQEKSRQPAIGGKPGAAQTSA